MINCRKFCFMQKPPSYQKLSKPQRTYGLAICKSTATIPLDHGSTWTLQVTGGNVMLLLEFLLLLLFTLFPTERKEGTFSFSHIYLNHCTRTSGNFGKKNQPNSNCFYLLAGS